MGSFDIPDGGPEDWNRCRSVRKMKAVTHAVDTIHPFLIVRRYALTPREKEILALVSQGLPSEEIAQRLIVSRRTVDFHLSQIYRKLKARNRLDAVRIAMREGLVPDLEATVTA